MFRMGWPFATCKSTRPGSRRLSYRPLLEGLEDRCLLSAVRTVPGFADNAMPNSAENFAGPIALGFAAQFSAVAFSEVWLSGNGNVTAGGPNFSYSAIYFDSTPFTIFAPFHEDIDTRTTNAVTYGTGFLDGHNAFAATWPYVGYYRAHNDKLNSFQVILIDRSDTGAGNFDIEFNYDQIQWDSSDTSIGSGGLNGASPAVAGFSAGTQQPGTMYTFPGSNARNALIDSNPVTGLVNNSLNSDVLGRYVFTIRNGVIDTNHAPSVDAGGPYSVAEGDGVTLNAVGADVDGDPLSYLWDVNGDGVFGDAAGATPTLTWVQLQSLGINDGPASFNVRVQVNDGHGPVTSAATTLSVTNTPPVLTLSGDTSVTAGAAYTLTLAASDPGQDTIGSWTIAWGDGASETVSGNLSSVTHVYTAANDYTISATADDEDGSYPASNSVAVHVTAAPLPNSAPVLGEVNTSAHKVGSAVAGKPMKVSATFTDADPLDTHTVLIDWGDGTTSTGAMTEAAGAGTISGSHTYAQGGQYTIAVSLADGHGGTDSGATTALVTGAGVQEGILYIIGTRKDDDVRVTLTDDGLLKVRASFLPGKHTATFSPADIERIIVRLGNGDDSAAIAKDVLLPALLEGGAGDDHLHAGGASSILLGGRGNDILKGGKRRDLLIGGTGADCLIHGKEESILIGGTTDFDKNFDALWAILAEWNSPRSREARQANLDGTGAGADFEQRLNGDYFLAKRRTVHNDGKGDVLAARNVDWIFANHKDWA